MIVVSDTTPLISLLKIDKVYLLEKLFGRIFIPQAVFDELVIDKRFEENLLTSEDVKECIEQLKKSGRHIGRRYYNMLLSMIDSRL